MFKIRMRQMSNPIKIKTTGIPIPTDLARRMEISVRKKVRTMARPNWPALVIIALPFPFPTK